MTLSQRLSEYIAAAFTGLWIHSFEHEDALADIARLPDLKVAGHDSGSL